MLDFPCVKNIHKARESKEHILEYLRGQFGVFLLKVLGYSESYVNVQKEILLLFE